MRPGTKKVFSFLWIFLTAWIFLRYLLPLTAPFLPGLAVALLAEPAVLFLMRSCRMPRVIASGICVTAAMAGICMLLLLVCSFMLRELGALGAIVPDLELTVQSGIKLLRTWMLNAAAHLPRSLQPFVQLNADQLFTESSTLLSRISSYILGIAGNVLTHIPDSALSIGTAVLAGYMISAKLPSIRRWLQERLPLEKLKPLLDTLACLRSAAWLWFLSQLKLMGFTYGILLAGFFLLRISYAPFIAFLTVLVDAFPVLGTGTVLLPWSLICLLEGDGGRALGLAGLYTAAAVTRSLLEPRLVGRQLGLDPLVTLIALYAGYRLWGLLGMLLMPLLTASAFSLLPGQEPEKRKFPGSGHP